MMMAIELGFLFKENAGLVNGKRLTPQRLIDFHEVGFLAEEGVLVDLNLCVFGVVKGRA